MDKKYILEFDADDIGNLFACVCMAIKQMPEGADEVPKLKTLANRLMAAGNDQIPAPFPEVEG